MQVSVCLVWFPCLLYRSPQMYFDIGDVCKRMARLWSQIHTRLTLRKSNRRRENKPHKRVHILLTNRRLILCTTKQQPLERLVITRICVTLLDV